MIGESATVNQQWSDKMEEQVPQGIELESAEETPEQRYNALVEQFVLNKGWSRRKARRYLDAFAKRENARIIKEGKARQDKLRAEGKLIDTSEDRARLEAEFQAQLEAKEGYKAKTTEF